MSSKYMVGGGSKSTQTPWSMPTVIMDGITRLEKTIAGIRREQEAIYAQIGRQREWLDDPANHGHELYDQRQAIHADRWQQWHDLDQQAMRLLDDQQAQIDGLEGTEKMMAIQRLLSWEEAPFLIAFFLLIVGATA